MKKLSSVGVVTACSEGVVDGQVSYPEADSIAFCPGAGHGGQNWSDSPNFSSSFGRSHAVLPGHHFTGKLQDSRTRSSVLLKIRSDSQSWRLVEDSLERWCYLGQSLVIEYSFHFPKNSTPRRDVPQPRFDEP